MRDVVGVHDRAGVLGVALGAGLVAEDPEGDDDHVERAVPPCDVVEHAALGGQVVGVELDGVDGRRARVPHGLHLRGQVGAAARGEHDGRPFGEAPGHGDPDLAAAAEYDDRLAHGGQTVTRRKHGRPTVGGVPEMRFEVRWPDGSRREYYSPSLVVEDYLKPGVAYPLADFVGRSREALQQASDRVRAAYGMPCSLAAASLARIERAAAAFGEGEVRVQRFKR